VPATVDLDHQARLLPDGIEPSTASPVQADYLTVRLGQPETSRQIAEVELGKCLSAAIHVRESPHHQRAAPQPGQPLDHLAEIGYPGKPLLHPGGQDGLRSSVGGLL
jgi:hypothetical protein